ncbi:MAG: DUF6503 family protein [Cellulophaga sp.]
MKGNAFIIITLVVFGFSCKNENKRNITKETKEKEVAVSPAKALIMKMAQKVGTMQKLRALKDVEYTYTFFNPSVGLKDVSTERYIFDGELSWAKYNHHEAYVYAKEKGTVIQSQNGMDIWVSLEGELKTEAKDIGTTKFLREANFYWFTMMPKLLDKGLVYELMEDRVVAATTYKIVKVTFNAGIGTVQDDFILYINPKTNLVDQFLFTVKGSRFPVPMLMQVKYEIVAGIYLMTKRKVYKASWDGVIDGSPLLEQYSENIKFNNGFTAEMFSSK